MGTKTDTSGAQQPLYQSSARKVGVARGRFVLDHQPLVRRICRRFSHSGEPLEDILQVEVVGLLKAIEKSDPDRGTEFKAFAVPVIVGEIKNYFRDHAWAVKIPRKLQRQKMLVEKTVDSLCHTLGRSPTILEIARVTGFSEDEVYDTFEVVTFGKPLSLDAENEWGSNDHPSCLLDHLDSEDPEFEGMLDRIDLTKSLRCLNRREQRIIYLKFYSGLPQREIAERLGMSQMHVSRLQRGALNKLRLDLAA